MTLAKKSIWSTLKDGVFFTWHFIQSPTSVGAILPSSDRLAKAIVRQIPITASNQKRYILEVGPGTGVFSEKIIKRMNPEDELHLVEFDPDFCKQLRAKFAHIPNVKIFEGSIIDFNPQEHMKMSKDKKYEFLVSGLPFNAFQKGFVEKVLNKYEAITTEGAKVSYFEYLFLPMVRRFFLEKAEAAEFDQVLEVKNEFYKKFGQTKDRIWFNMPPAQVLHHTIVKAQKNTP
jgi:phosphatidylethanolamine/phosphatidyl-N-methylethanolamine N-methyltransferase